MKIGSKIKKLRELRNYTQQYLATSLHISQPAYHKIESNKTNISIARLEQIAYILGVSILDIINFNEHNFLSKKHADEKTTLIIDEMHNLSDKEILTSFLEYLAEQKKSKL